LKIIKDLDTKFSKVSFNFTRYGEATLEAFFHYKMSKNCLKL